MPFVYDGDSFFWCGARGHRTIYFFNVNRLFFEDGYEFQYRRTELRLEQAL